MFILSIPRMVDLFFMHPVKRVPSLWMRRRCVVKAEGYIIRSDDHFPLSPDGWS